MLYSAYNADTHHKTRNWEDEPMSMMVTIRYSGKGNAAVDFAKEMTESGTLEKIRAEKGNLRYEYFVPLFDDSGNGEKTVLLIEQWENRAAIEAHQASHIMETIAKLREKHDIRRNIEFVVSDGDEPESDKSFIKMEEK